MKLELFPFNSFQSYFSADIMALYKGKWLLCMHKERTTWEHPSGWIEEGKLVGFVCFDSSAKGFFGPIGVRPDRRGKILDRLY